MLSQTVLLRGVNDGVETLGALMRALVECRIKPYYLHHADMAPGTAHFRTSIGDGQALMRALHGHYSGLCQPTYVLDIPGGFGKSPIGPNYLTAEGTAAVIEDFNGCMHRYPPQPNAAPAVSVQPSISTTVNESCAKVQAAAAKKTSVSNA
jgi:lysine 2,3-aminomutase